MKIFALISSPTATGKAALLSEFLRKLNQNNEIIVFHDTYRDGDLEQLMQSYNIKTRTDLTLSTIARADLYLYDFYKLSKIIKKENPDLILCCETNDIITAIVARLLSGKDIKILSHEKSSGRFLSRQIDGYIKACSQNTTNNNSFSTNPGLPVFNYIATVDYTSFFPANTENRDAARKHFGLDESDFVIGSVGRFKDGRGQRRMLRAFDRVKKNHPELKLLLAGFGENLPLIKWQAKQMGISEDVLLPGFLTDKLVTAYHAMDAFVLPVCGRDKIGRAAIEAKACKTPVFKVEENLSIIKLEKVFKQILDCNLSQVRNVQSKEYKESLKQNIELDFTFWFNKNWETKKRAT